MVGEDNPERTYDVKGGLGSAVPATGGVVHGVVLLDDHAAAEIGVFMT